MRHPTAACFVFLAALVIGCGDGGVQFETLVRQDRSAAPLDYQFLGVATTRQEAFELAGVMMSAELFAALDQFDPPSEIMVGFRVGSSPARRGEVGFIKRIREHGGLMRVEVEWTDDGVEGDDDDEPAPVHIVVLKRESLPNRAIETWIAVDGDGREMARATVPASTPAAFDRKAICLASFPMPDEYRELLGPCTDP